MWFVGLAACLDYEVDNNGQPVRTVHDTFVQADPNQVDILVLYDKSPSMAEEQSGVALALVRWVVALASTPLDWQLGVVTIEVSAAAGSLIGDPRVLDAETPSLVRVFSDRIAVETLEGDAPGLVTALEAMALTDDGEPNAGWRRPNGRLHLLFVTDVDDRSRGLGNPPVEPFLEALTREAGWLGLPIEVSAVVGPTPDGCELADGWALAGTTYHEIVEATGGVVADICAPDLGALVDHLVAGAAVQLRTEFPVSWRPLTGSLSVEVDGSPATGWGFDDETLIVRFAKPPPIGSRIDVEYQVPTGS